MQNAVATPLHNASQDISDLLASQLDLFWDRLPNRPYCTDVLPHGLIIRHRDQASARRYIQPNSPAALILVEGLHRSGS